MGTSAIAGQTAVTQSAMTRCVLVPVACLLIPPIGMSTLGKLSLLPGSAQLKIMVELAIIFGALQVALPGALAVFPQVRSHTVVNIYFLQCTYRLSNLNRKN